VFVHGVGAFTPLGATWPATFAALAEGKSAVAPVRSFDATGFPCTVAAEVVEVPHGEGDRRLQLALPAAREALAQTASRKPRAASLGIFLGAESGRSSLQTLVALANAAGIESFDHQRFGNEARALAPLLAPREVSPAAVAAALAAHVGAEGPVETVSLACASGSAAIAEAARAVRQGECDAALCGGVGADVDALMLAGFGLLGALSRSGRSRPFDAHRDGFVIGEGAALAVLSCEPSAIELAGEGRSLDAHHLTAPAPDGSGAVRSMRTALDAAWLDSVDVVQAHGTSTLLNDAIEAAALREVLGESLPRAHVSSVKGALGHTIAAAGALGFLCAVEAVLSGTILPTAGLQEPDADCALPHVTGRAISREVKSALVNSFAFGGANCTLVVRKTEHHGDTETRRKNF
jgi:3-oxoacyl-[acyl-carrier-protein] synthase II